MPTIPMDADEATTRKALMRLSRRKLADAIIHDRGVIRILREQLAEARATGRG